MRNTASNISPTMRNTASNKPPTMRNTASTFLYQNQNSGNRQHFIIIVSTIY